ncbi:MAG: hypothetical protein KC505_06185 [Myxococcales bacterium]|nr:hypothetical protein [Myxococcales bacterium]USN51858.1 MAG: hypothetical protein H6731_05475 [Myxococcales bacterium]
MNFTCKTGDRCSTLLADVKPKRYIYVIHKKISSADSYDFSFKGGNLH